MLLNEHFDICQFSLELDIVLNVSFFVHRKHFDVLDPQAVFTIPTYSREALRSFALVVKLACDNEADAQSVVFGTVVDSAVAVFLVYQVDGVVFIRLLLVHLSQFIRASLPCDFLDVVNALKFLV